MINQETLFKLDQALAKCDGDDKRILREEFFEPAIKDMRYSEPEVGVFASDTLADVMEAMLGLIQ